MSKYKPSGSGTGHKPAKPGVTIKKYGSKRGGIRL